MTSNLQVFIKSRVFIPKYANIKTQCGRSKVVRPIRQQYKHTVHCTHRTHTIYTHTEYTFYTVHTYTCTLLYPHCTVHTVYTHYTTYHQATVLCTNLLTRPRIYTALIFPTYCSLISPYTFVNTRDVTFQP